MQQQTRTPARTAPSTSSGTGSEAPSVADSNSLALQGWDPDTLVCQQDDWVEQLTSSLDGSSDVCIDWSTVSDFTNMSGGGDQVCEEQPEDLVCEQPAVEDQVCEVPPEDLICQEEHEDLVCEAEDAVDMCVDGLDGVDQGVPAPVCEVEPVSRDLQAGLTEELAAQGLDQAAIDTVWLEVQRATAGSFGTFYDALGELQRNTTASLDLADAFDALYAGSGAMIRTPLSTALQTGSTGLATTVLDSIVEAAMLNVEGATGTRDDCLEAQIRTWLEGQLPASALGSIDLTAAPQDVRRAVTQGFADYRTAVQTAVEGIANAPFRQYITGDASGLSMQMMIESDFNTQLAADDAAGTPSVDAGHFHATAGTGAGAAELQTMLTDIYGMQTTSNVGHQLMADAVGGARTNFDMNLIAVSGDANTSFDSFRLNTVDIADIHTAPEGPGAGHTAHPQSRESVYAHFISERLHDAQNNADSVATRHAALEVRRNALVAQQAALTAAQGAIANALYNGNPVPAGSAGADVTAAQTFVTALQAYEADLATLNADQAARFPASHQHGLDVENQFNAEHGYAHRP